LASRRFVAAFSGAATGANAAIFGLFCYPQALPVTIPTIKVLYVQRVGFDCYLRRYHGTRPFYRQTLALKNEAKPVKTHREGGEVPDPRSTGDARL